MDWLAAHVWHLVATAALVALDVATSVHAILRKRDPRAATLWVAFIWLSPVIGGFAYIVLGVNRIRRDPALHRKHEIPELKWDYCQARAVRRLLPEGAAHLEPLACLGGRLVERPLLPGNHITPLVNGDEAYPAMLAAIEEARRTVSLSSYIFDYDATGREFAGALERAVRRGVTVRVLVDDAGARYSFPSILSRLRRSNVPVARFMPRFILLRLAALNLRSHRKILVTDGRVGFTGGMNIRHGNRLRAHPPHPVQDVHFRIEGPVVAQLQQAFVDDWAWCTGERLAGEAWFPALEEKGDVLARGITDGPDEDLERIILTLNGAFSAARHSIRLATPYFLPDATMVSALNTAALRGVAVEILLPAENNLPFVHWASEAHWWQILLWGCRLWLTPPPFDHSKLAVVDGCWSFVGSSNLDPRSLRLNFEFNVEAYSRPLAAGLEAIMDRKRAGAREVTLKDVNALSLPVRLRDGLARLATPFL